MIQRIDTLEARADPWFVDWAKSRGENKVEQRPARMGLSPWLPKVKERNRWSDRWREVERPLFPGYLFAKATSADWQEVPRIRAVLTVGRDGGRPAHLDGDFVAALRDAMGREGVVPESVSECVRHAPGYWIELGQGGLRRVSYHQGLSCEKLP